MIMRPLGNERIPFPPLDLGEDLGCFLMVLECSIQRCLSVRCDNINHQHFPLCTGRLIRQAGSLQNTEKPACREGSGFPSAPQLSRSCAIPKAELQSHSQFCIPTHYYNSRLCILSTWTNLNKARSRALSLISQGTHA
ncbi:hypothetical protein H2248_004094 [Termitomyces sp. 'cryptogamus']|nr:hypothetical protein H2248_004094 [Termitomyces sp. 'cryptogamus']